MNFIMPVSESENFQEMEIESTVSVNISSTFKVKHQATISQEELEELVLKTIKDRIAEPIRSVAGDVKGSVEQAHCWSSTGRVNVGSLFFDVSHCEDRKMSSAAVDIMDIQKSGYKSARVTASVCPHAVYLTAIDVHTGNEAVLSKLSLSSNGQLVLTSATNLEENIYSEAPIEGFVRSIN